MIPFRRWFEELADQASQAEISVPDGADTEPTQRWLDSMTAYLREFPGPEFDPEETEDERLNRPLARFIHLKGTQLLSSGMPVDIGLWRGRMSEVDGWSIANGPG
jgi:hypothetical protein